MSNEPELLTRPQGEQVSFAAAGLDEKQVGHLRRIADLAYRLPDDWSGMMGRSSLQEDFGALRFQLAYMSYALALTYRHRLPAAPAVFKDTFDRLIQKMLSPDVWTYWHYVSTGGGPLNASLGELAAEWDPVAKDNIMYSAYVQSMANLYQYLFDDDKYDHEAALSFELKPLFWGGYKSFSYSASSLNEHLYWMMVEKGYLGIACEPNCVFQICNQPAILGFRINDLIHGGDTAAEVTEGYKKAWMDFGITNGSGHFNVVVMERERLLPPSPPMAWGDFWLGALMHAWYPEQVRACFPAQIARWQRPGPDGSLWIEPTIPPVGYGRELTQAHDFGWAAVCAAEVGDTDTLERLLRYADLRLTPTWENGAFYYHRRDGWFDDRDMLHAMDPHTGNALLAYARLNVPCGLHDLYHKPLTQAWRSQPNLSGMPRHLDVTMAYYDPDARQLRLRFRPGRVSDPLIELQFANVWGRADWSLRIDGARAASGSAAAVVEPGQAQARRSGEHLLLTLPNRAAELVLQWAP